MPPSSPFDTAPSTDPLQSIFANLEKFVGNPMLRSLLESAIGAPISNAMRSAVTGMAGGAVPFGGSALNGPMNVGAEYHDFLSRAAVSRTMDIANRQMEAARMGDEGRAMQNLYGVSAASAAALATRSSLTGFAANMLFEQLQPKQFLSGLEEGSRYMGVGATYGMSGATLGAQTAVNTRAGDVMGALSKDFFNVNNFKQYGGLKGQDVGRLVAELSRTGAYVGMGTDMGTDPGSGADPAMLSAFKQKQEQSVQGVTRRAAQTIKAMQQIFNGSVTDMMDQLNSITGTNFIQTFGGRGMGGAGGMGGPGGMRSSAQMVEYLAAAGYTSGFDSSQMSQFAAGASSIARQSGQQSWGATSNAAEIALQSSFLRNGTRVDGLGPMSFIDESAYRENIARHVVGAQTSSLARYIAGGATAVSDSNRGKFISDVEAMARNHILSPTDVLRAVQQNGGGAGVAGAEDLYNRSYLGAGMQFMAQGVGTHAAMLADASSLNATYRSIVGSTLGLSGSILDEMSGASTGMTLDSVRDVMRRRGRNLSATDEARIAQSMDNAAKDYGWKGGRFEASQFLSAQYNLDQRNIALARTESRVGLQERYVGRGAYSGWLNVRQALASQGDWKQWAEIIAGKQNLKVDDVMGSYAAVAGLMGQISSNGNVEAQYGMGLAMQAVATGMVGSRQATEDEVAAAESMFSNGKTSAADLTAFGHRAGESAQVEAFYARQRREATINNSPELSKKRDVLKSELEGFGKLPKGMSLTASQTKRQQAAADELQQLTDVQEADTSSAHKIAELDAMLRQAGGKDGLGLTELRNQIAAGNFDGQNMALWNAGSQGNKAFDQKKFDKLRDDAYENDPQLRASGTGMQEHWLQRIFELIRDKVNEPGGAVNTPAAGGFGSVQYQNTFAGGR